MESLRSFIQNDQLTHLEFKIGFLLVERKQVFCKLN